MDSQVVVQVAGEGFLDNLTGDLRWVYNTVAMLIAAFSSPEPELAAGAPLSGMYLTRLVSS